MMDAAQLASVSYSDLQQQQPDGVLTLKAVQTAMNKTTQGVDVSTAGYLNTYFGIPFKDWSCWTRDEAHIKCKHLMHCRAVVMDTVNFTPAGNVLTSTR
jgi:hypothetical protein